MAATLTPLVTTRAPVALSFLSVVTWYADGLFPPRHSECASPARSRIGLLDHRQDHVAQQPRQRAVQGQETGLVIIEQIDGQPRPALRTVEQQGLHAHQYGVQLFVRERIKIRK